MAGKQAAWALGSAWWPRFVPAHYAGRNLLSIVLALSPCAAIFFFSRATCLRLRLLNVCGGRFERRPLPRTPTGDPLSLLGGLRRPPAGDAPIIVTGAALGCVDPLALIGRGCGGFERRPAPAPPGRVFFMVCCHVGVAHVLRSCWLHCAHGRKRRWAPIGAHPSVQCGLKLHPAAYAVVDESDPCSPSSPGTPPGRHQVGTWLASEFSLPG